ncbi:hypothetical protein TRFO_09926 [Tritrichomonas foetus]|uniref:Uncharacterized protein n=1 Tax=Tritrichomonas foetus TaxID=1144522 RepID=A0A1J4JGF1_9EUKA|nr:hypothetical protein TRFO_09926 [Tritrichomonas foetus]|eukprot:OHS96533.1 hypothetical protein TRFO_09926 [Tritrichomonas foetus]
MDEDAKNLSDSLRATNQNKRKRVSDFEAESEYKSVEIIDHGIIEETTITKTVALQEEILKRLKALEAFQKTAFGEKIVELENKMTEKGNPEGSNRSNINIKAQIEEFQEQIMERLEILEQRQKEQIGEIQKQNQDDLSPKFDELHEHIKSNSSSIVEQVQSNSSSIVEKIESNLNSIARIIDNLKNHPRDYLHQIAAYLAIVEQNKNQNNEQKLEDEKTKEKESESKPYNVFLEGNAENLREKNVDEESNSKMKEPAERHEYIQTQVNTVQGGKQESQSSHQPKIIEVVEKNPRPQERAPRGPCRFPSGFSISVQLNGRNIQCLPSVQVVVRSYP